MEPLSSPLSYLSLSDVEEHGGSVMLEEVKEGLEEALALRLALAELSKEHLEEDKPSRWASYWRPTLATKRLAMPSAVVPIGWRSRACRCYDESSLGASALCVG